MGAFFSSAGPTPSWCPHPPSWATQGTKKAFDGVISTLENDFGVVFLFLIKHKRRYSANTKKPGNPHDSWTFSWSWKRDLNTRPADYESAALPTELFQHIPISVTFYPLRLQPEAQCVPARLFTLSNNQRPADYESAALPTELCQRVGGFPPPISLLIIPDGRRGCQPLFPLAPLLRRGKTPPFVPGRDVL